MRLYGLIGYPLSHSYSKRYFTEKFQHEGMKDCIYENFSLENISELPSLIKSKTQLRGFNVTTPHKQSVMSFLTDISDEAKQIGAVNTIKITNRPSPHNHQLLIGYNTDAYGFENSLKPLLKAHHNRALILGTGGAAKAVAYVLNRLGIDFVSVSRKKTGNNIISYDQLNSELIGNNTLIINTTPLGTFPDVNGFPAIPYQYITSKHLLYDLVYNPEETLFLQKGSGQGAAVQNGLAMLELQAEKAWEIWNK